MCPPTSYSVVFRNFPFSMIEAFAVVPPMSKVTAFASSRSAMKWRAARTPAAGPDSIMLTGSRAARSAPISPPPDCMMSSGPEIRSRRSCAASESM